MNSRENQVFNFLDTIEYIFSKKSGKQKAERKWSVWFKPRMKNRMYTIAFNSIFAELMVNDKEELRRYFHS